MNNTTAQPETTPTRPDARLMAVGPETAKRWLARNSSNRKIRKQKVADFAADIRSGAWQITGEAIKFSGDGRLLDGQHRLAAVVEAGQAITTLVVSGVTDHAQSVMDSGTKRTAADALHLRGHVNTNVLAATARLCIGYESGAFRTVSSNDVSVTHSQVLSFVDLNPDVGDAIKSVRSWRLVGRSVPAAATAMLYMQRIDANAARQFVSDVIESKTTGRGDPRSALIHRLNSAKARGEQLGRVAELYCIWRAWNAVRDGEELKLLKFLSTTPMVSPK